MKVELRNTTKAGNNVRTELFIDDERIGDNLHMNHEQHRNVKTFLSAGVHACNRGGDGPHTVEFDDE